MLKRFVVPAVLIPLLVIGCDSAPTGTDTDPTQPGESPTAPGSNPSSPTQAPGVGIQFGTSGSTVSAYRGVSFSQSGAATDSLVIAGTNGTLRITDVRFIVAEFELKRANVVCDGTANEHACEKFKAAPSFVDLPLAGGAALAVTQQVPVDTYKEMEFEIEDLDADEDDSAEERAQVDSVFAAIRSTFADWPGKASMVVEGSFTPSGSSEAKPFRVYFEAEIEIEREFEPPLVIADSTASKSVTMQIEPAAWFKQADGTVVDLSERDYTKTGQLVEFELDMEHGFGKAHEDKEKDD